MSRIPKIMRVLLPVASMIALTGAFRVAPVHFHAHLLKSDPSANDTLAAAPKTIKLWFTERVDLPLTRMKLTDAAGTAITLAAAARPDTGNMAPVVATVGGPLANGRYTLYWSTAALDGHPAKGQLMFTVRAR